jgi:hypothetical protein
MGKRTFTASGFSVSAGITRPSFCAKNLHPHRAEPQEESIINYKKSKDRFKTSRFLEQAGKGRNKTLAAGSRRIAGQAPVAGTASPLDKSA